MRSLLVLPALLFMTACGPDPRDSFVGNWEMSGKTTTDLLVGGQPQNKTSPSTPGLYALERSSTSPGEIVWQTAGCDWSAEVTTDQSFTVNRNVCPPSNGSCVLTITVTQGTGTRTGSNLAINARGDVVGSCGASAVTGTVLFELTGTKK
ncbi:MAG: hypothetical protein ACOZQL_03505 [Myxococcota bacterium]